MKGRLRTIASTLDPLALLDEIRAMQHQLAGLAVGASPHVVPHRNDQLDEFLKSLATAWQHGEVRPTHQIDPKPARDWRTRKDPFEDTWPRVRELLEAEPDRVGKDLFRRLQAENPGVFHDGQLRTLQRRIKEWRAAAARQLVFATSESSMGVAETSSNGTAPEAAVG